MINFKLDTEIRTDKLVSLASVECILAGHWWSHTQTKACFMFISVFCLLLSVMQDVATKTERGRRIGQAVADTGKAVGKTEFSYISVTKIQVFIFLSRFHVTGGALNSARSFVSSWLSELTQSTSEGNGGEKKDEKEMDEEKEGKVMAEKEDL